MTVASACIALLGLLLFGLGFAVSMVRGRTGTTQGFDPDPANPLTKLVRAHGNTAEYAPMLAILILFLGSRDPATWVLWTMGVAVAARYLLAAGLVLSPTLEKPHPLRFVGALFTYLAGFALSGATFAAL